MGNIARRNFCGTALLALPLLCIRARAADDLPEPSDAILDNLADEFTRIAADGAQNGFKSEHLRRCAGLIRTYDVRLEEKGTNRDLDHRLDEDDFQKLNPSLAARRAVEYWNKHGLYLKESVLRANLTMNSNDYQEMKQGIKKSGGVRKLHASVADALEQKAVGYESYIFKGTAMAQNGRCAIPLSGKSNRNAFLPVQDVLVPEIFGLPNMDCFCKAMTVEGALLSLACVVGCAPCCVPAAIILAFEQFAEGVGLCSPSRC
jgi:hypothetical protein